MIKRIVPIAVLIILNLNSFCGFAESNEKAEPKRIDKVIYYSPCWFPDGKKIAYIKRIAHMRQNLEFADEIIKNFKKEKIRTKPKIQIAESITYQICILDLDTNKEEPIASINVKSKFSPTNPIALIGYEWEDKKYEGITHISSLDVNPINDGILFDTKSQRDFLPISSSVFYINMEGENFKKIIINGGNPKWSFDSKKIVYGKAENTNTDKAWEIKYSLWVRDLEDNSDKKIISDSYAGILGFSDKIIYYSLDKRRNDYSLIRDSGTYISSLDGRDTKMITNKIFSDWSRDSNFILESWNKNNALEGCIYYINGDKKICNKNFPYHGRFSQDGKKIVGDEARVITSNFDDSICIVNVDGSNFKVIKTNYEATIN